MTSFSGSLHPLCNCRTFAINLLNLFSTGGLGGVLCINVNVCRSTLTTVCGLFPPERPVNADQQERTLLKGVFSVRKGKTQLHKWAERQVILCGTCLIVASVKDSLTGKMHILPLVGGKVRVQCLGIR